MSISVTPFRISVAVIFVVFLYIYYNCVSAKSGNLLKGIKATYSLDPNYRHSKGHDDKDLTDGNSFRFYKFLKKRSPWTSKDTVTWAMKRKLAVEIRFDLGSVQFMDKLVLVAHSGCYVGVCIPLAAFVYVSEDGENWSYSGDLINEFRDQSDGGTQVFNLDGLNTRGRYLAIYVVRDGHYINLDEIELYKNDNRKRSTTKYDHKIGSIEKDGKQRLSLKRQKQTTLAFIDAAKKVIISAGGVDSSHTLGALKELEKKAIEQEKELEETVDELGPPYTKLDRKVAAMVGEYFSKNDMKRTILWSAEDTLWTNKNNPFMRPHSPVKNMISLDMAQGEIEPGAFNVTNNTNEKATYTVNISRIVGQDGAYWPVANIDMRKVAHVVGGGPRFYDDALTSFTRELEIEPGMTKQVWVLFNSKGVGPGTYKGSISIKNIEGSIKEVIGLTVKVYPVELEIGGSYKAIDWAYFSKSQPGYGIEEKAASELKRAHSNVQVVLHEQIPWPKVNPITGDYILPIDMDFSRLDQMINLRPDVDLWLFWPSMKWGPRRRLDYYKARNAPKVGTDSHKKLVRQWVRKMKEHMNNLGYDNKKFAFYWYDESSDKHGFLDVVVPFSALAKEVDPTIQTFATHSVSPKLLEKYSQAVDIHCISTNNLQRVKGYNEFFQRHPEKKLWHYRVDSEKNRDPHKVYRLHHTYSFVKGMAGAGIWSWNSKGGQWRDQLATFPGYAMVYTGLDGVVTTKRREAWREGIEDVALWNALMDNLLQRNDERGREIKKELGESVLMEKGTLRFDGKVKKLLQKKVQALEILSNGETDKE